MTASQERSPLDDLFRDYRTALLRFLPRREEAARVVAYEIGRRAFTAGIGLLDVCKVHNDAALEILCDTLPGEYLDVTANAAELLLEVVAAYDMTHRRVLEP